MEMKMHNKKRSASLVVALIVFVTVAFFEKINALITFSYTKEITLVHSEQVTIGWLEVILKPFSLGLFASLTSLTGLIVIFVSLGAIIAMRHKREYGAFSVEDYHTEHAVFLGSISNRAKMWFLVIGVYAALEVITNNFNMMTIANVWRFDFHGGASVPTSPISLTYIGTMIEYFYMVSIKHFFNISNWSLLEIVFWSVLAFWILLKAHVVTSKQTNEAKTIKELLSVVPAAFLAVLTSAFAPYRLTESTALEDQEVDEDIRRALSVVRVPKSIQESFISRVNNQDSIFYLLKDRHATYTHYLMNRVSRKD